MFTSEALFTIKYEEDKKMPLDKKQRFFLYNFWERKLDKKESKILDLGLQSTLAHMGKLQQFIQKEKLFVRLLLKLMIKEIY